MMVVMSPLWLVKQRGRECRVINRRDPRATRRGADVDGPGRPRRIRADAQRPERRSRELARGRGARFGRPLKLSPHQRREASPGWTPVTPSSISPAPRRVRISDQASPTGPAILFCPVELLSGAQDVPLTSRGL
jgi:hypothetical protein